MRKKQGKGVKVALNGKIAYTLNSIADIYPPVETDNIST